MLTDKPLLEQSTKLGLLYAIEITFILSDVAAPQKNTYYNNAAGVRPVQRKCWRRQHSRRQRNHFIASASGNLIIHHWHPPQYRPYLAAPLRQEETAHLSFHSPFKEPVV